MKLLVIIGIALISEYNVSCEFKCRTNGCIGQKELNGQWESFFKGQEHTPCLKFSHAYVSCYNIYNMIRLNMTFLRKFDLEYFYFPRLYNIIWLFLVLFHWRPFNEAMSMLWWRIGKNHEIWNWSLLDLENNTLTTFTLYL